MSAAPEQVEPSRCSARSMARMEPLLGTASRVRRWVLVEQPGPWGIQALRDSRLPAPVLAQLRDWGHRRASKVLLIRRPGRDLDPTGPRTVMLAATGLAGGLVARATVADPADLLDLPLDGFLQTGRPPAGFEPVDDLVLLVCTHGRHDACCAELGRPLAAALCAAEPEATWEVSHLGGDRFAGNVVVLPDGLYLGRVPAATAGAVAGALRDGQIPLPYLRGRSCYGVATQAAEIFIRESIGLTGRRDLRLVDYRAGGPVVTATFAGRDGRRHEATVRAGHREPGWRLTCRTTAESTPHTFELLTLRST